MSIGQLRSKAKILLYIVFIIILNYIPRHCLIFELENIFAEVIANTFKQMGRIEHIKVAIPRHGENMAFQALYLIWLLKTEN